MSGCNYCGRSFYLNEGDACKGCGASISPGSRGVAPVIMYDSSILDANTIRTFGPRVNIPVKLPPNDKLSDHWIHWSEVKR